MLKLDLIKRKEFKILFGKRKEKKINELFVSQK